MPMIQLLVRTLKDSGSGGKSEETGLLYGYYPNGKKTHIHAKPEHAEAAMKIFDGTGINVSTVGERYRGVETKVNGG